MWLKKFLSQYPQITETDDEVKEFLCTLSEEDLKQIVIDYDNYLIHPSRKKNIPLSVRAFNPDKVKFRDEGWCKMTDVEYISGYFNLHPNQIRRYENLDGVVFLNICIPLIGRNFLYIKFAMEFLGYKLLTPIPETNAELFKWFVFELIKDDTAKIREEERTLYYVLPYQYHVPNCENLDHGLFDTSSKTYFLRGSLKRDEVQQICSAKHREKTYLQNCDNRYVLYTIDITGEYWYDRKLYIDSANSYGIYATEWIPWFNCVRIEELLL